MQLNNIKSLAIKFIFFTCVFCVFSQEKESYLVGSHLFFCEKDYNLSLMPPTSLSIKSLWQKESEPVLAIEKLWTLPKNTFHDIDMQKLSLALRAYSSMQGIQYYSNRRKAVFTLYEKAYRYDGKNKNLPLLDDTSLLENGTILYCYQKDSSLGDCCYKVEYNINESEVCASFSNIEGINYGIIPAVKKGELCIMILVKDIGENLQVYMQCKARFPAISLFASHLKKSLDARVDSIYDWFIKQL